MRASWEPPWPFGSRERAEMRSTVSSKALRVTAQRLRTIDMGDVHLASGREDRAEVLTVPIQVINRSFYEEGRISFTCSEFVGPGPINKPVMETRLPAYTRFNPSHFENVKSKAELTTTMTVHIANNAESGYYKALVQALPLDSWTVVSLRVR